MNLPYVTTEPDQLQRQNTHDAGLDIRIAHNITIKPHTTNLTATGLRVAIPTGYFGLLTIRSSLGLKGVTLANAPAIIDSGYRGEIKLALHNLTDQPITLAAHNRVAQLVILKTPTITPIPVNITELPAPTDYRGIGGFGSTGQETK